MALSSVERSQPNPDAEVFRTEAWMGGVRVRLESDLPIELGQSGEYALTQGTEPALVELACRASFAPRESVHADARSIRWTKAGERLSAQVGNYRAEIERVAGSEYSAVVECAAEGPLDSLVEMLAHSVLVLEGGVALHACAAELDGRVFLFLGPSGAGKSTAVSLLEDAKLFALDRVALLRTASGWQASPLPGGNALPGANPRAVRRCLPLGGILQVVKGSGQPAVVQAPAVARLAALRAAAFRPGDPTAESPLLDTLLSLMDAVPIAAVHTVLGRPLQPTLQAWMGGLR